MHTAAVGSGTPEDVLHDNVAAVSDPRQNERADRMRVGGCANRPPAWWATVDVLGHPGSRPASARSRRQ